MTIIDDLCVAKDLSNAVDATEEGTARVAFESLVVLLGESGVRS